MIVQLGEPSDMLWNSGVFLSQFVSNRLDQPCIDIKDGYALQALVDESDAPVSPAINTCLVRPWTSVELMSGDNDWVVG